MGSERQTGVQRVQRVGYRRGCYGAEGSMVPEVRREPGELTESQQEELDDLVAGGGPVDPSTIERI